MNLCEAKIHFFFSINKHKKYFFEAKVETKIKSLLLYKFYNLCEAKLRL